MSDYTVDIRHTGGLTFQAGNGRAILATEYSPGGCSWHAAELFLAGIGSCMLAALVDYAQTSGIEVNGAGVEVSAESATQPMRMSQITVTYRLPPWLSRNEVDALVRAGKRCRVHNTIEHQPEVVVRAEKLSAV